MLETEFWNQRMYTCFKLKSLFDANAI